MWIGVCGATGVHTDEPRGETPIQNGGYFANVGYGVQYFYIVSYMYFEEYVYIVSYMYFEVMYVFIYEYNYARYQRMCWDLPGRLVLTRGHRCRGNPACRYGECESEQEHGYYKAHRLYQLWGGQVGPPGIGKPLQ